MHEHVLNSLFNQAFHTLFNSMVYGHLSGRAKVNDQTKREPHIGQTQGVTMTTKRDKAAMQKSMINS